MNNLDQNYYSKWLELNELTNIKGIIVLWKKMYFAKL